jgi:hypothetical protein
MDAEGNAAYSKEAYESHVRRLMVILDQEQQARLRVEDKLEEARVSFFSVADFSQLRFTSYDELSADEHWMSNKQLFVDVQSFSLLGVWWCCFFPVWARP